MKKLCLGLLITVAFFSCSKEKLELFLDRDQDKEEVTGTDYFEQVTVPEDQSFDITGDNVDDFIVRYAKHRLGEQSAVVGLIYPLDTNELLVDNNNQCLFLQKMDTIYENGNLFTMWTDGGAEIMSLELKNKQWNDTWTVKSGNDDLYIGLKINSEVGEKLSWAKIDIDIETGKVSLLSSNTVRLVDSDDNGFVEYTDEETGEVVIDVTISTTDDFIVVDYFEEPDVTLPFLPYFYEEFIDVNSDGIDDFMIHYNEIATMDYPSSGGSRSAIITPLNGNKILYKYPDGYLFLQNGDIIFSEAKDELKWLGYDASIMSTRRSGQVWDDRWTIDSEYSDYYLAIKLAVGDSELVGWMKLDLDDKNGRIKVIDIELSTESSLEIN